MRDRVDIMVDIETLGTDVNSTIFQIAGMSFDIRTGLAIRTFDATADISKNEDICATGSTIRWWMNNNKELFQSLLNEGEDSSDDILLQFYDWIANHQELTDVKNIYLWGNGNLFDNSMISSQFKAIGLDYPIFYGNDRDVRTILELASMKLGVSEQQLKNRWADTNMVAHNAIDDVYFQVDLVSQCYNILVGEESY